MLTAFLPGQHSFHKTSPAATDSTAAASAEVVPGSQRLPALTGRVAQPQVQNTSSPVRFRLTLI
jgi:hypothetical protein